MQFYSRNVLHYNMTRYYVMILLFSMCGYASAHQWTPTYPALKTSYASGALVTTMELLNSREDVSYYEIGVFDKDFLPVPFATAEKIINLPYLSRKSVDIFIRQQDASRVVYICSKSKLLAKGSATTSISSRICSKIK